MYIGDIRLGDTIDVKFTTVDTSGVPTTLAGTPVVSAYVGNGTTELTAGITLTVDFDGRTGMHNVRVVASSGNGYATATNVMLVITTGTVGGSSVVGYVVGAFSIEARSAVMPTVAGRTLDVTSGGAAGIDWANIENPTTAVNLSATNIDADQVVASVTGAVGSVTGAVGSVTGAVGSVTGNVGGNVVGTVGSVVGAVGSVTGNVGGNLNGNVVGSVGSVVGAVGSVTAPVTVGTNNDKTGYALSSAGYNAAADALLDRADGIEVGLTPRQTWRLGVAADAGKLSGATTATVVIRNAVADSKDRITASVDGAGNRTAVTVDVT